MKNLIILYSTIFFFLLSCQDNRLENVYEDNILFVKSGKTEVSGFLSNDKIEFNVPIYRSGLGDSDVEVTIEVDPSILGAYTNSEGQAMALLPSDKYVLDNSNIKFSGDTRSAMSKLTVDIKSLHSIQEILDDKHAIPLVIKTKGAKASEKRSELVVVPVLTGGI